MISLLIILLAFAIATILIYNQLVRLKNLANEGWSGIDVQLKRRADLIPNLVNTVKAYAAHEKALFEEISSIRSETLKPHTVEEQGATEAALTQGLRKLMIIAEAYPELKANTNFLELQKELSAVENTLQKARRYYNGTVRELNTKIETFPSNLIARLFTFSKKAFFSLGSEAEGTVPQVNI
jgi:LemA protein